MVQLSFLVIKFSLVIFFLNWLCLMIIFINWIVLLSLSCLPNGWLFFPLLMSVNRFSKGIILFFPLSLMTVVDYFCRHTCRWPNIHPREHIQDMAGRCNKRCIQKASSKNCMLQIIFDWIFLSCHVLDVDRLLFKWLCRNLICLEYTS